MTDAHTLMALAATAVVMGIGAIAEMGARRALTKEQIAHEVSRLPHDFQIIASREADVTARVRTLDRRQMRIIMDTIRTLAAERGVQ